MKDLDYICFTEGQTDKFTCRKASILNIKKFTNRKLLWIMNYQWKKIGYSTTLGKMCEYLTTIGEFADFQVVLIQNLFRHIYNYQD